ncbi:U3 small nucleolar RNA-associated protein 25 homolog isoform X2 [Parasteatoda tepidariorum]|uniref:U3 small nucleolar RNA-associated protein 25 homolog isoform X2 n=2 Tax=Parasteatoda tepidariorum TaxID=114398 RepID=UPI00077FBDF4|nr:U3 small nucleolar RNA-associated protein 25 homolog isoform X2 [Parasteatoda tepidariorum]
MEDYYSDEEKSLKRSLDDEFSRMKENSKKLKDERFALEKEIEELEKISQSNKSLEEETISEQSEQNESEKDELERTLKDSDSGQKSKSKESLEEETISEQNESEKDELKRTLDDSEEEVSENDLEDETAGSDIEEEVEEISDPCVKHFEFTLPDECTEAALSPKNPRLKYKLAEEVEMPGLGQMNFFKMFPHLESPPLDKKNISEFALKKNLLSTVSQLKKQLTGLEMSFLNIITNYIDVLFTKQYFKVREKLRRAYCIHILNHILKSKARIIHHNSKMKKNPQAEYRDQGFTQPTVFILAPFRGDCHRIVNQIISLMPPKCKVMNKTRFEKDYGPTGAKSKNKPEDFYEIFDGNNNEDFKIGLRIQNEHITLFSDFYKSDLIIASPLGLRPIIGDTDNRQGDADFLSSVEVFIVDRLDVLVIQNPVHLGHVLLCMNHLVKKEHGNKKINYFRVREYALDKKAKYYRQNIYLSAVENSSFVYNYYMSHCYNYVGHMRSHDWVAHPIIEFIYPAMQMCFRVLDSDNPQQEYKDRRKFFTEKILPEFVNDKSTVQTLIYVPSYFDYVELRHHFRTSEISCFMMCEYTDKGKKAQGRDLFFKGHRHFMLYTERTHFYFRHWIKGIQHVIFYKLPTYPKFFREICNSLMDSHPKRKDEERTCTVIVSPRDFLQLKHVVGIQEADKMLKSKQKTFVKYVGS